MGPGKRERENFQKTLILAFEAIAQPPKLTLKIDFFAFQLIVRAVLVGKNNFNPTSA